MNNGTTGPEIPPTAPLPCKRPTLNVSGAADSGPSSSKFAFKPPENWALAPEFIPRSYVQASSDNGTDSSRDHQVASCGNEFPVFGGAESAQLCPYFLVGVCRFGNKCSLIHGNLCDLCGFFAMHPFNKELREKHRHECLEQHERDMELSFAVARSADKTCGICMDVIREKTPTGDQRFGLLPACNHCFCLRCIRRWRQARQFENKIIRACPECRVTSDFVVPSRYWIDSKEEKEKMIKTYKVALSKKSCRHFKSGAGTCPFGNKCFYQHALANGTPVDVGPPRRLPRGADGTTRSPTTASIWEFLEEWELQWMEIEDFMDMFDSDDQSSVVSDGEDYDFEYERFLHETELRRLQAAENLYSD